MSTAQQVADTMSRKIAHPIALYYQNLGEQSPLYNGREYIEYSGKIQVGHPFYGTTEFTQGSIHYYGMEFEDAMMLYDIVKDRVIIRPYDKLSKIDLLVEKISEFKLLDHHFVRLSPDSSHVIKEGFYDRLYQGKIGLFCKREKSLREELTRNDLVTVVDEKNTFFIEKQGVYYPVKTLRSLLKVLPNRKETIRKYLDINHITFRKNREAAILMAVKHYDSFSN
ncbi:MAG TPA: hypothetical protein VM935_02905 [Chitinophagaceae bacterium]|jgi:hypothetical protein|nr:hypothetical protein [Chitinophagaceae bacterium]